MSEYLSNAVLDGARIKDLYRLRAIYDESTGDWIRDGLGNLDGTDIYIECSNGDMIYDINSSKRVMQAYISSKNRGRNILKAIYTDILGLDLGRFETQVISKDGQPYVRFNIEDFINHFNSINDCIIFNIYENDLEIQFDFHLTNIEPIAKLLKAKKPMASKTPFNSKYLPSHKDRLEAKRLEEARFVKYEMPKGYWGEIKPLLFKIAKVKSLKVDDVYNYIYSEFSKIIGINIIKESDKNNYKPMHYIHYLGKWNEFLEMIVSIVGVD